MSAPVRGWYEPLSRERLGEAMRVGRLRLPVCVRRGVYGMGARSEEGPRQHTTTEGEEIEPQKDEREPLEEEVDAAPRGPGEVRPVPGLRSDLRGLCAPGAGRREAHPREEGWLRRETACEEAGPDQGSRVPRVRAVPDHGVHGSPHVLPGGSRHDEDPP